MCVILVCRKFLKNILPIKICKKIVQERKMSLYSAIFILYQLHDTYTYVNDERYTVAVAHSI